MSRVNEVPTPMWSKLVGGMQRMKKLRRVSNLPQRSPVPKLRYGLKIFKQGSKQRQGVT